jgi:hypothetical protein
MLKVLCEADAPTINWLKYFLKQCAISRPITILRYKIRHESAVKCIPLVDKKA